MKKAAIVLFSLMLVFILAGCQSLTGDSVIPTVSVSASASVSVTPDSATFSITSEATEDTTEEARNATSLMIERAVNILKEEFGITDDSLKTDFMQVNPYYEWLDGGRTLIGQKATQKLTIVLTGENLSKVGKVYDRLGILDGIAISSISYSKLDTSNETAQAREMAAKAAFEKAEAYAKGLGKRIGTVISVSDGSSVSFSPTVSYNSPKLMMVEAAAADYSSTTIYQSDITISDKVTVVFTLVD